jgi:Flp pilus assembly pilin Flp
MPRLNRRGRRVRAALIAALIAALVIAGVYALSALIWWTGEGYCLGTMAGCIDI